jgi:HPt (histidine-containing phosphotransfer) domain-containing protein
MDDYLSKPIQGSRIAEALARVVPGHGPDRSVQPPVTLPNSAVLEAVGGDMELLREVQALLESETPILLEKMSGAIASGDPQALAAAAHSFKGMYAVFAPNDVIDIAKRLEELGRRGVLAAARPEYDRLLTAVEKTSGVVVQNT